jgi:monoamine oxidase
MKTVKTNIIIIGAGLTGLTLAYYLRDQNVEVILLEARERLGGRIYTKQNPDTAPIELGATWISKQHTEILELLSELEQNVFEQKFGDSAIYEPISTSPFQLVSLPKTDDTSYRVKNGTQQIIERLVSKLDPNQIYTGQAIKSIRKKGNTIIAKSNTHEFEASIIISTLPPLLFVNSIKVNPQLPNELIEIAERTHTWMGESIKIALTYDKDFWTENHLSGTIFSNVGPIPEMYDHSNFEDSLYALKGFLNGAYFGIQKNERLSLILNQLEKYYGEQVKNFISYEELVWKNEPFTTIESSAYILPHQNNGNPVYQKGYLNDSLFLAGTETSTFYSGYMEGAISSAKHIYSRLKTIKIISEDYNN